MNRLTIIGNLTRDPEVRTTTSGVNVCSFTVAVNRRKQEGREPEADFFKVNAWRQLSDICAKYLSKGKKVCVVGPVSVHTFTANDGSTRASLEVTANDIEFLSPRDENAERASQPEQPANIDAQTGFQAVETDELPF